jgi:tRNA (cmo5U34)-methyltransferase
MTEFEKTNWSQPEFSRGYRDNADVFIVERRRMLAILQSYYAHFLKNGRQRTMLDLGCGDGIVASAVAEIDNGVSVTLVDGSRDMLKKAKERLKSLKQAACVPASFQEIIRKDLLRGYYDFIASSLAIHHLTMQEKAALFRKIFKLLNRGGHFVNIDVVLAPSASLEKWYLSLWRDWIDERKWDLGIESDQFNDITRRYKNAENKPDPLLRQLEALKAAGFADVDCYYQYGIFTIFGGRKPL